MTQLTSFSFVNPFLIQQNITFSEINNFYDLQEPYMLCAMKT